MADVARRANRGQLLVITALALAVMLSLMALTLNTAVFGEVYVAQTDENLRDEREAVQFQAGAQRGVAGLLPAINERYDEYDALENGLEREIANWTGLAKREYAHDAIAANASLAAVSFETLVIQNESRDFTDQNGSAAWTVAENVSSASGYEMNVSEEALVETSDCAGGSACFALTVDGENASWRMFVYTTGNTTTAITVKSSAGTENCDTTNASVVINVTDGVFDDGGDACAFTTFLGDAAVDPPYTVAYTNANNVSGTYALTVPGRIVTGRIADDDRYGTTGSPRLDPRIAAANVTVRFRSLDLVYVSERRVSPGEADG